MFGQEFQKFESSYNRSIKIYADLPLQTHRNLIEPVSALPHMKVKVIRNYLNFIETIRSSEKSIVRLLYAICSKDCRTVTGKNLRNILLLTTMTDIDHLSSSSAEGIVYKELSCNELWKVNLIHEILDMRAGCDTTLPDDWQIEEMDAILISVCTD